MKKRIVLKSAAAAFLFVYPCCAGVNKQSNPAPDDTAPKITYIVPDGVEINSKYRIDLLGGYIFIAADNRLFLFTQPTASDIKEMVENKSKQEPVDGGNSGETAFINPENPIDTEQRADDNTDNIQDIIPEQEIPEELEIETNDENLHIPRDKIEIFDDVAGTFIHEGKYYYINNQRKILVFDNDSFHAYNVTIPDAMESLLFEKTADAAKKETKVINKWYDEFTKRITNITSPYSPTDEDENNFPRWLEFKKYVNDKTKNNSNNAINGKFAYLGDWVNTFYKRANDDNISQKRKIKTSFKDAWGVDPSQVYPSISFPASIRTVPRDLIYIGKNPEIQELKDIYDNLTNIYDKSYMKISKQTDSIFTLTAKAIVDEIKEIEKTDKPEFEESKKKYNENIKRLDSDFIEKIKKDLETIQFNYEGQKQNADYVFLPAYNDIPAYIITQNPKPQTDYKGYTNNDIEVDLPDLENTKLLIPKSIQGRKL